MAKEGERESEELTIVSTSARLARSLIELALCAVESGWTKAEISDGDVVVVDASGIVLTRLKKVAGCDGNVACRADVEWSVTNKRARRLKT